MARAMTSQELTYIRTDSQASLLFMAIHKPTTVYTALVNQTFSTLDEVSQITYAAGSGTLANVLPGMTMYVSALGYGQYELGMVRIRKTPTATIFYLGENSEIKWANNLFLTVVDQFGLWARHLQIDSNNVPYMDFDIAYTNQHKFPDPVPVLGPRYVPAWLLGANVVINFDASASWCINSTITGYSWTADGGVLTNPLTATPTLTVTAVGLYRLACTVTAANGKTTTGYVYVQVFDRGANMPINQFTMKDASGSWTRGGWQAKVTMYSQADFSSVVDRALVVIFARDFYGTTEVSLGPIANRENIKMIGWIDGESIEENPDGSSIEFTIETVDQWMNKISGFPVGILNKTSDPAAWTEFNGLTVDASVWHLLYWRSTIIPVTDVYLSGDARLSFEQSVPGEMTIWQQLQYLATNTIMARGLTDRFNRFWCIVDTALTPVALRSVIPLVLTLTYKDWRERAKFTRYIVPPEGKVALSGVAVAQGFQPAAIFSLSPGHVPKRFGQSTKQDRLLLADQTSANELAGMILGRAVKNFDFEFDLAGNNPMVDIVPNQYVGVNIVASDTPRGVTFSGNMLVREIHVSQDDSGFRQISWRGENETFPENSTNGDIPISPPNPPFPPFPPLPPIPPIPPGPVPPVPSTGPANVMILTETYGVFYTKDGDTSSPHWFSWNQGLQSGYLPYLWKIDISDLSPHRGFLFVNLSEALGGGIYTADYPGGTWRRIVKFSDLYAASGWTVDPTDNPRLTGFGINRSADDELRVLGGVGHPTLGLGLAHWAVFICNKNGVVSMGADFNNGFQETNAYGLPEDLVYGGGKWLYQRHPINTGGWILGRFNRACTIFEGEAGAAVGYLMDSAIMRCALDTPIAQWLEGAGYHQTPDNLDTRITWPLPPNSFVMGGGGQPTVQRYELVATSPSGLNIIASDSSGFPKRSSDGGVTFSNVPGLVGVTHGSWNCGDEVSWLCSIIGQIQFTPDFGATFLNKTGDLQSWTSALVNIIQIRSAVQ